jgi:hypothetical protein
MLDHIKKQRENLAKSFSVEKDPIVKGGPGSGRKKHSVSITKKNSAGGEAPGEYHYHARTQFEAEGMHIRKYGNKDAKHVTAESHNKEYEGKAKEDKVDAAHDPAKKHPGYTKTTFEQDIAESRRIQKSRIASTIGGGPLSNDEMEKSATDYFEKGRKANVGEVRKYGGKDYIKTANGWKLVGKNKGKYKEAHDAVHGKKEESYGADASKLSDDELEQKYNMYKKQSSHPDFNEHGKKLLAKYEGERNKRKKRSEKGGQKFEGFRSNKEEEKAWFKIKKEVEKEDLGLSEDGLNRQVDKRFKDKYGSDFMENDYDEEMDGGRPSK